MVNDNHSFYDKTREDTLILAADYRETQETIKRYKAQAKAISLQIHTNNKILKGAGLEEIKFKE